MKMPVEREENSGRQRSASRLDRFAAATLAIHLALALSATTIAWPEVTTPAYLWSRGLVLYRDIKFVHTPGLMALLAAAFAAIGVNLFVVRGFPIFFSLIAHGMLLKETRWFAVRTRVLASAFFLVHFYAWQGNSIWPSVILSALALPISRAMRNNRCVAGGSLIGIAILVKQTAAAVLVLVLIRLLWQRRHRQAALILLCASGPYLLALLAFTLSGAGAAYLRWTLFVPFQIRQSISVLPPFQMAWFLLMAFLPLILVSVFQAPLRWYLTVAAGFALMAWPRFSFLQILGAVPCLAVGAAWLVESARGAARRLATFYVAALVIPLGLVFVAGESFSRRVLFWNDDPVFNRLIAYLQELPPATPLYADVWGNILPRSGLLPPGGIYVHPWLSREFGLDAIDSVGERVEAARRQPGTVLVGMGTQRCRIGPYSVRRLGKPLECPAKGSETLDRHRLFSE